MKISVIGLGYVGLPLASLLSKSFDVVGYEVDNSKTKMILEGQVPIEEPGLNDVLQEALQSGRLIVTSDSNSLLDSDVKVITVGTPYDSEVDSIDYSQLDSAMKLLVPFLKKGDVIILKSTVPPGTTTEFVKGILESADFRVPEDIGLVFSPERIVEGQAISDFLSLPKIIGATDERSARIAREILSTLGGHIIVVSDPNTAEFVKMIDNYVRFTFLGVTNELALAAERFGIDIYEAIEAAKLDYPRNSGILVPGPGVGGSCLNKDPYILRSELRKRKLKLQMVEAAREINDNMPLHVFELVERYSKGRRKILVAGISFKRDTNDIRFTPASKIVKKLKDAGYDLKLTDPYVMNIEDNIVLRDFIVASVGREIILFLTDHTVYKNIDIVRLKEFLGRSPLIIDTRNFINRREVELAGIEYHGIGRP